MFEGKNQKKEKDEYNNTNNIIGEGTIFKGDIESLGNLRIEGRIVGNIHCKVKIATGKTSRIEGDIHALNAEIDGFVSGKLMIDEVLVLKPSAVVNGDIRTNNLIVEAGAIFTGKCKMGESATHIKMGEKINPESEDMQKIKAA